RADRGGRPGPLRRTRGTSWRPESPLAGRPAGRAAPFRASRARIAALAVGAVLAVAATGTLVLTDNPRVLRLAVVVALLAFVIGAMAGGRRRPAGPAAFAPRARVGLRRSGQGAVGRGSADP